MFSQCVQAWPSTVRPNVAVCPSTPNLTPTCILAHSHRDGSELADVILSASCRFSGLFHSLLGRAVGSMYWFQLTKKGTSCVSLLSLTSQMFTHEAVWAGLQRPSIACLSGIVQNVLFWQEHYSCFSSPWRKLCQFSDHFYELVLSTPTHFGPSP